MQNFQTAFEIRFGYGVNPDIQAPLSPQQSLLQLGSPDPLNSQFIRPSFGERIELIAAISGARRDMRNNKGGAQNRFDNLRDKRQLWVGEDMRAFLARAALSQNGFRERLVAFWSDHFTVSGKSPELLLAVGDFIDQAIRPNLAGRFSELLRAAVTHPAMLFYLDQNLSVGPNSPVGQRRNAGLNENLAREILELHTLGVGSAYTQGDVRQFAELLTGLGFGPEGVEFSPRAAEPGPETILGNTYGGDTPALSQIFEFLDDLSLKEETARHLSQKLCVHFISQSPPQDLVAEMSAVYLETGGQLLPVYEVMLGHPASATGPGNKVKWPVEYVVSSVRALGLAKQLSDVSLEELKQTHMAMQAMGQDMFRPLGPDGWPEQEEYWITPPTLATRIGWAAGMAQEFGAQIDPVPLAQKILGAAATSELLFAAKEAESKWEAVALVLVSPQFNRR